MADRFRFRDDRGLRASINRHRRPAPEERQMTERPILFSAPMVQAILEGRKTQTRRAMKPPAPDGAVDAGVVSSGDAASNGLWWWLDSADLMEASAIGDEFRCPYGVPGDHLWVRENFQLEAGAPKPSQAEGYRVHYMTDGSPDPEREWGKGQPSIHLPRWASRILLEIEDVRVERLQAISEEDALAEGMTFPEGMKYGSDPVEAFRELWRSINGTESLEANPFVWVVSFKRVT